MAGKLGNERAQARAREREKVRHAQLALSVRAIASTPDGARVLREIIGLSNWDRYSFDLNPLVMAKNEGRREMGLLLRKWLVNDHPELFVPERDLLEAQDDDDGE